MGRRPAEPIPNGGTAVVSLLESTATMTTQKRAYLLAQANATWAGISRMASP